MRERVKRWPPKKGQGPELATSEQQAVTINAVVANVANETDSKNTTNRICGLTILILVIVE